VVVVTAEPARPRGVLRSVVAIVAVVIVAVLVLVGFTAGSGPASQPLGRTDTVVIVSVPGLRWQDLVATETPALDAYLGRAGLMSVRAIGPETSVLEGHLTIGAGNRVEADSDVADVVDGRCIPGVIESATRSAEDDLNGAVPGALGATLRAAGVMTSVFGPPEALAALMDVDGCVDEYAAELPTEVGGGVTVLAFVGLERVEIAADRAALLRSIDARLAELTVPDGAIELLVAPSAVADGAEVTVVGVRTPAGDPPGSLVSPTTRRADYVTLPDVAPAVLASFGLEAPESMNGTEMRATGTDDADRASQQARLADLAERIELRDRAVGPVSVVLVMLTVICGVAAIGRRARLARMMAPIVVAYPIVAFASGLVAYHQLPLNFFVVMVPVLASVLAAVAVSAASRVGPWAPVGVLSAALWLVLVVDVVTGGRLQINTPLGYTPTVAGRFQGFGNLSFGLVGASAVVTAVLLLHRPTPHPIGPGEASASAVPVPPTWVAAFVGAVTAVAVAAPAFGSDVGGTLAIVPTFVVIVTMIAGRRVGWKPLVAVGAGSVVLVTALAALDMARPASSRTHLGRFLDELLNGDGGLVIRRKMRGNLAILTSSFWSFVLVGVVVLAAVIAWRRRSSVLPALQARPALRVFLAGFGIVAFLGFALNDSGLAVPAIMLAVAVPWVVASVVPVVKRAGR
jgi:hypothetical protein